MGPHLFCIRANVSALCEKMPEPGQVGQTVVAIGEQAEAIQTLLRRLLQRLRPAGLGELGLAEALRALVGSWRSAHPEIQISLSTSDDFTSIDENIGFGDLPRRFRKASPMSSTCRCNQSQRRCGLRTCDPECGGGAGLRARVEDNGIGVPEKFEKGLGLTGMSERVRACGGRLKIVPRAGKGTLIEAVLPLVPEPALESA